MIFCFQFTVSFPVPWASARQDILTLLVEPCFNFCFVDAIIAGLWIQIRLFFWMRIQIRIWIQFYQTRGVTLNFVK